MICYKDMAFCSDGQNCSARIGCDRFFGYEEREKAVKWWGGNDAPVAFMNFAATCKRRKESDAL